MHPFRGRVYRKRGKGQGPRTLTRVNGHWTPKGLAFRGKPVRSGIFVNTTGKTEEEKEKLFDLAKEELGEKAEGLDLYEVISV